MTYYGYTSAADDLTLGERFQAFLRRQWWRLCGGAGVALGVCALVALASYDPADASWNTVGGTATNILGSFGATLADAAWQYFGVATLFVAVLCLAWGWRGLSCTRLHWWGARCVAAFIALAIVAPTLTLILSSLNLGVTGRAGGAFGEVFGGMFAAIIYATWLTPVLCVLSFFLALPLFTWSMGLSADEWRIVSGGLAAPFQKFGAWWNKSFFGSSSMFEHPALREPELPLSVDDLGEPDDYYYDDDQLPEDPAPDPTPIKRRRVGPRKTAYRDDQPLVPPTDLLNDVPKQSRAAQQSQETLRNNAEQLQATLQEFGVQGQVLGAHPGPVVTLYELEPAPGTRAARVVGLSDDIARQMCARAVRVATVPGRNALGIELPNAKRETVYLRELLESPAYEDNGAVLPLVLGKDIGGHAVVTDLARMPHLLVAGTTGSGKSVAINAMILSLLYKNPPEKCRLILIDPKMLELSVYEGIPHLLTPVVTEPKKAILALKWAVREMEDRYRSMAKLGVRNIDSYNQRLVEARDRGEMLMRRVQTGFDPDTGKAVFEDQPLDLTELPYIVLVVDEMADLMLVAGKDIEAAIQRLAQMARAAGIHLIMATQRPSVDVITGTIKANFPTRISFQVTSKIDSRTILGEQGAEQLLGMGDMLYMAGGGRIMRVHGPFVQDAEVESVVSFLKERGEPVYVDDVTEEEPEFGEGGYGEEGSGDELYDKAVALVARERKASTSFIQRHLSIGYNRAAKIMDRMEAEGVVSTANHVGKREILIGSR
ncbi:MAG: DNA translocase FtsK [Bdellovibrionales bacterium]